MNNKSKRLRKIVSIVAVCLVVLIVFLSFIFKLKFGRVDSYITALVDIYIPTGISDEFKQELSIDIYEYWIFKLNDEEQGEITKDIKSNNWRVMTDKDVNIVEERTAFDKDSDVYKSINNHKCYIYIFDCDNEIELPNNKGYFLGNDCFHWLFFIYDTETNYYYVIHQSM